MDFIWASPRVYWSLLGSFGCALGAVGIIRTGSVVSFGHALSVILFRSRTWGDQVHSGSLGSFRRGLQVGGFHCVHPRGSLGSIRRALGDVGINLAWVVRFIWAHSGGRWFHWGTPLGSSGVVGFIQERPGGRWVHLGAYLGLLRSFGFVGFIRARPCGRLVY